MKALANFIQKRYVAIFITMMATMVLVSCSKNDDGPDLPNTPSAGLMAFNLAPDRTSVGFALGSNQLGAPLGYTGYTGNYLPINVGSRQVRAFDANNGQTLAINTYTFSDSALYSVFLVGYNGVYRNVIALDDNATNGTVNATPGKAWIRYVNAVADTGVRANVTLAGIEEEAAFGVVPPFRAVNAGTVTVGISSDNYFNVSRNITLEENKVYTVLFVGIPGNSDPQLAPQAKYIVNGTAD